MRRSELSAPVCGSGDPALEASIFSPKTLAPTDVDAVPVWVVLGATDGETDADGDEVPWVPADGDGEVVVSVSDGDGEVVVSVSDGDGEVVVSVSDGDGEVVVSVSDGDGEVVVSVSDGDGLGDCVQPHECVGEGGGVGDFVQPHPGV